MAQQATEQVMEGLLATGEWFARETAAKLGDVCVVSCTSEPVGKHVIANVVPILCAAMSLIHSENETFRYVSLLIKLALMKDR